MSAYKLVHQQILLCQSLPAAILPLSQVNKKKAKFECSLVLLLYLINLCHTLDHLSNLFSPHITLLLEADVDVLVVHKYTIFCHVECKDNIPYSAIWNLTIILMRTITTVYHFKNTATSQILCPL